MVGWPYDQTRLHDVYLCAIYSYVCVIHWPILTGAVTKKQQQQQQQSAVALRYNGVWSNLFPLLSQHLSAIYGHLSTQHIQFSILANARRIQMAICSWEFSYSGHRERRRSQTHKFREKKTQKIWQITENICGEFGPYTHNIDVDRGMKIK